MEFKAKELARRAATIGAKIPITVHLKSGRSIKAIHARITECNTETLLEVTLEGSRSSIISPDSIEAIEFDLE